MSCSDSKEREGGAFGSATILLPVTERVDADAHGSREARLGQADESSERRDVVARLESTLDQTLANTRGNGPCELLCGELGDVSHVSFL